MIRTSQRAQYGSFEPSAETVTLREAIPEDVGALTEIERDAFPTQWPPTRFRRELERTRAVYLVAELPKPVDDEDDSEWDGDEDAEDGGPAWARMLRSLRNIPFVNHGVPDEHAEHRARIIGFAGLWFMTDEAHIVSVAVRHDYRHRGVGELLMIGALGESQRRNCRIATLEVRESNWPARRLYLKCGFEEVGVRKRYYMDNGEDAVIMTTPEILRPDFVRSLARLERHHQNRWGYSSTLAR